MSELTALLPCKPDQASRQVALAGPTGGQAAHLRMMGCDAQGATFAVSVLTPGADTSAPEALALWRKATLSNLSAQDIQRKPLPLAGISIAPEWIVAHGKRPDGGAVTVQALWWVHGPQVYHAVIYAERISTEMSDSFFTGLKVKSP